MADSGFISLSESYMAATIAASATFQTVTGAANAAAALSFIHRNTTDERDADAGDTFARPRALIWDGMTSRGRLISTSRFQKTGLLYVDFEFAIPAGFADASGNLDRADWVTGLADFKNTIGAIIEEIETLSLSRVNGYLFITEWERQSLCLMERSQGSEKDYWLAQFAFEWQG